MTQLNKPGLIGGQRTTAMFSTGTSSTGTSLAIERRSRAAQQSVCDTARVDIENWHSRRYWSGQLGLSEAQLVRAVRVAGAAIMQIEQHLAERRARRAQRRRESANG